MSMASFESYNYEYKALNRLDILVMEEMARIKADLDHTYITKEERGICGDDFTGEFRLYNRIEGSRVVQLGSRVELDQEIDREIRGGQRLLYKAIIFNKSSFEKKGGIYEGHDIIPYTSPLGRSILGHRPGEECVVDLAGGKYTTVRILNVD